MYVRGFCKEGSVLKNTSEIFPFDYNSCMYYFPDCDADYSGDQ